LVGFKGSIKLRGTTSSIAIIWQGLPPGYGGALVGGGNSPQETAPRSVCQKL